MAPYRLRVASAEAEADAVEYATMTRSLVCVEGRSCPANQKQQIKVLSFGVGASSCYSGDVLEIYVEETKFVIAKSIICKTSEFFNNAAKPVWRDGGDGGYRPITLDDDSPHIFNLYTIWLYNGSIDRADRSLKTWEPLSQAYIMGEKFMDGHFQFAILEAMIGRLAAGRKPDIQTMNDIYHGTSEPSPARQMMIDVCVWEHRSCLRNVDNPAAELHEDFVRDLLVALMALPRPDDTEAPLAMDTYHYLSSLVRDSPDA